MTELKQNGWLFLKELSKLMGNSKKNQNNKAEKGLQASVEGFTHEHITAGILMKKYK